MNVQPKPTVFVPQWQEPDTRFLDPELPDPPEVPLDDVFKPRWAKWVKQAAEAKGAPPDYVLAALLNVAGSCIGNARWVSAWQGWTEPPIIWAMVIGTPSMNKSPGLDSVLSPLRRIERQARKATDGEMAAWNGRKELAELATANWKEKVKSALKKGMEPPDKPRVADPGPKPVQPRYAVTDVTVEKVGTIIAEQPRGALLFRDELSGWLQSMTRYSGGGSDRPFWLEAYGGRAYSVERMGREPVYIPHLSVGVLGGIQPDRLKSLLFKADDDGLLARFLPVWPRPAPISRPKDGGDDEFIEAALKSLISLKMPVGEDGTLRPSYVQLDEEAAAKFQSFREAVREWENGTEGLLLSFIGKLPGLVLRLSLILALLDFAGCDLPEPDNITKENLGRAAHLVEAYILPMARRAYADASVPKETRMARRLVSLIRENSWRSFTARDVQRLDRAGLATKADLDPVLAALEDAQIIRAIAEPAKPVGGRPQRLYSVNPSLLCTK